MIFRKQGLTLEERAKLIEEKKKELERLRAENDLKAEESKVDRELQKEKSRKYGGLFGN